MKKHQSRCNDCKRLFFLEDAPWCKHHYELDIGTKECPHCHNCICHGETVAEIQARFDSNIAVGKFIKVENPIPGTNWNYQCKTIVVVEDIEDDGQVHDLIKSLDNTIKKIDKVFKDAGLVEIEQ